MRAVADRLLRSRRGIMASSLDRKTVLAERLAPRAALAKTLVRVVLYVIFVVYAGALILGGWPAPIRPSKLDDAHKKTRSWLIARNIHPGKMLFLGAGGPWKSDLTCVTVEGLRSDGTLVRLHSTFDGCAPPAFRIYDRAVETAHVRFLVPYRNARPKLTYKKGRKTHLAKLRRRANVRKTARYYCESTQIDEPLEEVFITLFYRSVNYDNGKRREVNVPLIHYDCERKRRLPLGSLETTWTEGYGPGVALEDAERSVRR